MVLRGMAFVFMNTYPTFYSAHTRWPASPSGHSYSSWVSDMSEITYQTFSAVFTYLLVVMPQVGQIVPVRNAISLMIK